MIKVIGKQGCGSCVELKERLTKEGVKFNYILYEDLNREDKRFYANIIRSKNNGHFPLAVDENNEIVNL